MPRHIYGELARTMEGCEQLAKRSIVFGLLTQVHQQYERILAHSHHRNLQLMPISTAELSATLWSLGHIGASYLGYRAITSIEANFVDWCVDAALSCPFYNIRGTFMYILGLLSRTELAGRRLLNRGWDFADPGGVAAVAIPRKPSILFRRVAMIGMERSAVSPKDITNSKPSTFHLMGHSRFENSNSTTLENMKLLTPNMPPGNVTVELEILSLIVKVDSLFFLLTSKSNAILIFLCLKFVRFLV